MFLAFIASFGRDSSRSQFRFVASQQFRHLCQPAVDVLHHRISRGTVYLRTVFSGKDCTKVDRSAAYAVVENINGGLAKVAELLGRNEAELAAAAVPAEAGNKSKEHEAFDMNDFL